MKVNKSIEKPSHVLGLPMQDFIILLGYFGILFILNNILGSFGLYFGYWFYIFLIFSTWGIYIILKWAGTKKYPGYLISLFSFKSLQGKNIEVRNFTIKIKN